MRGAALVLLLVVVSGCKDSTPPATDGGPGSCGPNLRPYKTACVPMLDDCAKDHVPVPGGGCKRIGVDECTTSEGGPGIKGPPERTCERVGPPRACLPGWAQTQDGQDDKISGTT